MKARLRHWQSREMQRETRKNEIGRPHFWQIVLLLALVLLLGTVAAMFPGVQGVARGEGLPETQPPPIRLKGYTIDPAKGEPPLPPGLWLEAYPAGRPAPYLVQLTGPMIPEWREALEQQGVTLLDYVPELAYLVQMDAAQVDCVRDLSFVRWVGLFQPAYKLDPVLLSASGALTLVVELLPGGWEERRALRDELAAQGLRDELAAQGLQILSPAGGLAALGEGRYLRVQVGREALPELLAQPEVLWVEPYRVPQLLNDVARSDAIMGVERVWWDLGLFGSGQVLAVCDTGLDVGTTRTLWGGQGTGATMTGTGPTWRGPQ